MQDCRSRSANCQYALKRSELLNTSQVYRPGKKARAYTCHLPFDHTFAMRPVRRQYEDFMQHVYTHGVTKTDRTGTGTRSVFGHQMRFDLNEGFPLVTTKKVFLKAIIVEQLGVDEEEVTPDASFVDDLGADSLDTVELVMALEEEFETEIPDEFAEKITTVQQAIDYINAHAKKA